MSLDLTVTDLFCGAGGSSIGAEAMGAKLRIAANHWQLAIDTHAANFPDADHDCADISQVDPRRYPSTDILLASPECTHHSQARSKKHTPNLFDPNGDPAAERSRATMWDIPRFAERHQYKAVVVENVVEVAKWPPFDAWLEAMRSFGYKHRLVSLNSMVAEPPPGFDRAPQSRDRLYVVFWREGDTAPDLEFRPQSYCWHCEVMVEAVQSWKRPDARVGKYRQQYVYRCGTCGNEASPMVSPSAAAIDWTIPCPRIGDRTRPLSPATRRRIEVGLERFAMPVIAQAAGHTYEAPGSGYARVWPTDQPMPTQTTTLQHGVAVPPTFMVPLHHLGEERRPHPTTEPWPTQTGRNDLALVVPLRRNGRARDARAEPVPVVTAGGQHHAVVYVKNYGDGNDPSMVHPMTDPLGTVTSQDHHSLVALPFTVSYYRTGQASPVDGPLPTVTCIDRHALVEPMSIDIDDCGFRMFEPAEIGRAMAFPVTYKVEGTKRDRVRMYGNAVTPPSPAAILQRCVGALV